MRLFTLFIIVISSIGCGTFHISPVPPTPTMSPTGLMVMQGINIQHDRGGKARIRFAVIGADDEPGHFGRNWGKYLSSAAVILGDYLEDGEWDAYGIIDRGSSDSSSDCDYGDRDGELFILKGKDIKFSIHGESLSDNFVVCADGEGITFSTQPAEPLQLLLK